MQIRRRPSRKQFARQTPLARSLNNAGLVQSRLSPELGALIFSSIVGAIYWLRAESKKKTTGFFLRPPLRHISYVLRGPHLFLWLRNLIYYLRATDPRKIEFCCAWRGEISSAEFRRAESLLAAWLLARRSL